MSAAPTPSAAPPRAVIRSTSRTCGTSRPPRCRKSSCVRASGPLLSPDRAIGALVIRRKQPGLFRQQTLDLLQPFAAQSVLAIQNARLFREIEEKSRQLEVANLAQSRFLAAASHDLRQPLHALGLFVAQLRARVHAAARLRPVH